MAKIDVININGKKEKCVNLHFSVGIGGINHPVDVLMIQYLLDYLFIGKQTVIFHQPKIPILSMTGFLDIYTIQSIMLFQTIYRTHLLKADGLIEPAKYENRVIKDINKPLMTITLLHLLAKKVAHGNGDDYLKNVLKSSSKNQS